MASSSKPIAQLCVLLLLVLIGTSCIPNRKLVYFSDAKFNTSSLTPIQNQPGQYLLQPQDILSIKVKTLDEESADYFNIQPENVFLNINQAGVFLSSYSIDEKGNVGLPEVGPVAVGGLTVEQAQQKIQEALAVYLSKATILVKLVSFKVTVLGEVQSPGHFYVYNNRVTILEALGMAGDLNDFGNRENITLIRQTATGSGAVLLDLRDPKVLASEFYYLQPNDVLYIQPLKAKASRGNLGNLNVLSLVFGAVSTAILLLTYIK
jgi:polysaccharide biosynthesis/export protein